MNTTPKLTKRLSRNLKQCAFLVLGMAPPLFSSAYAQAVLQGQNKGDTLHWTEKNLQGWSELEVIPMRICFGAGMVGKQNVRLDFPHINGGIFGFEGFWDFQAYSPNATILSGPEVIEDPSGEWSYTLTVEISDRSPAEVRFSAQMAAGAHLNGGSSLQIKGTAGTLQIHKPGPATGAPDLAVMQSGPTTVPWGTTVTYTMTYQNRAASHPGMGAQLSQIVDPALTIDPASLGPNARVVGHTVFWDLGNLAPNASGQIVMQAKVNASAPIGQVLTNVAQIYSSENDLNMADNSAVALTSVVCGEAAAAVLSSPAAVTVCPGESATFSTTAVGPGPLAYQWRKDGTEIAGATDPTFTIAAVSSNDVGSYDVLVSSQCDTVPSGSALLSLRPGLPLSLTSGHFDSEGAFVIEFGTSCGGTYLVEYSSDLLSWKTSPQTATGNGLSVSWRDAGQPATESMPTRQQNRFYRVVRVF